MDSYELFEFIFLSDEVHLFNLRTLSTPNANEKPDPSALLILHRQGEDCERNNNTGGFLPKFRYGFKLITIFYKRSIGMRCRKSSKVYKLLFWAQVASV